MRKLYEIVGLGGTFDRFHAGHEHFIKFASQFGQHLHIGITHPKLAQGKYLSHLIEPYETRKRAVIKYCKSQQISGSVIELTDPYGPTLEKKSKIRALVVTEDTVSGANKINQTRTAMDLRQLPVQVCPLLRDEDGQIISSERIRAGEINRAGQSYQQIFKQNLILTTKQRNFFSQPQGEIVSQPQTKKSSLVCVVGDHSLEKFIQQKWPYDLAVYDLKEQRSSVESPILASLNPEITIENPAGSISLELNQAIQIHKLIFVDGEEDLAAVSLMLSLPLGSKIYYGQPNQGLIEMTVTEEKKEQFFEILNS
ncbi:MAG: pantetheine-phosphate adenylyltransferase [Candidatus Pacebacteria bacterium]|nr:pantetheine-phosphate adenylyltransferase [Candidatus Paceibacterota bacterium]MBT6899107.1 pantetheine-phosphate adenylyltransferase [Candidatus Paceibacterota bacterium]MBT7499683.1 pantetheine-phosphate adenylyltransferase [Candidatus Paceibacterota bacterium]